MSTVAQAIEYKEVKAEDVLKQIEHGEDVYLENCRIVGEINLTDIQLQEIINPRYYYDFELGYLGFNEKLKVVESNISIKDSIFENNLDFSNALFKNSLIFVNVNCSSNAKFVDTYFNSIVGFRETTFNNTANFGRATFYYIANFDNVTFNSNANFGFVTFCHTPLFENTKFRGHAWFNKAIFKGDAWFSRVSFNDSVLFNKAIFRGSAWFKENTYNDTARFEDVTFESDAWFDESVFEDIVDFKETTFNFVTFERVTFSDTTEFTKAVFNNYTSFNDATFADTASFKKAIFNYTTFVKTIFDGSAIFTLVNFNDDIYFTGTIFNDFADFGWSTFSDTTYFRFATFNNIASFEKATFNNSDKLFGPATPEEIVPDGGNYQMFMDSYKKFAQYDDADTVYYNFRKEFQAEKKWYELSKWIDLVSLFTCGYGVKPLNTLYFGGFLIIVFSIIYATGPRISIYYNDNIPTSLLPYLENSFESNKDKMKFLRTTTWYKYLLTYPKCVCLGKIKDKTINLCLYLEGSGIDVLIEKNKAKKSKVSFKDALYFSITTFTTVGYGNWYPKENFRKWATLEGLLGWIMLGIFMATLTTVMIRV